MSEAKITTEDGLDYVEDGETRFGLGLKMPSVKTQAFPTLATMSPLLSVAEIRRRLESSDFEFGEKWFDTSWLTNQNGYGSCFPAGTMVRLADGTQKPIEQIQVLDSVVTAEGNTGRVLCVQAREHKGEAITLKLWGHRHLKATPEHPILTKDGYKALGDVTTDDWVAIPKYTPAKCGTIVPEEYCEKPWRMLKEPTESPRGIEGKTQVIVKRTPVPAAIKLDYSFGRIVGLFLAEGSTTHGKVVFSLSKEEYETLGLEIEQRFSDLFGVTASRVVRQNKTIVRVYGSNWVDLFQGICAEGSANKRIHRDLWAGPDEFLRGVLTGWEAGDGIGPGRRGGVTVSHALALDMYNIANQLGLMPVITSRQPKLSHGVKSRRRRYDIKWSEAADETAQSRAWRCEQDESVMWRKVAGTEAEDFDGVVFNLEVEGDHSYVAEGIGVHNCAAYAGSSALAKARVMGGQQRQDLSGDYLYSLVNGQQDRGSMLDDNMRALMNKGVALKSTVPLGGIYRSKYDTARADAEARRFRGHELYALPDEQSLATALVLRYPVVIAIHVGRNWRREDSRDVLVGDDGPGNHSEHLDDIRWSPQHSRFEFREGSSHDRPYFWVHWGHLKTPSRYHQFYAVPSAIDDPQGDNPPNLDGDDVSPEPQAEVVIEKTTMKGCGPCESYKANVEPQLKAAGYTIKESSLPGNLVPRFKVTVGGREKSFVGYHGFDQFEQIISSLRD